MNAKKLGIVAGVLFVIFFVMQQPTESAGLVRDALGGVGHLADKLAVFVKSLVA